VPDPQSWTGQYEGVAYEIADGAVQRVDGGQTETSAAREVAKAKRVYDLVAARPDFAGRLLERQAATSVFADALSLLESGLAEVDAASASLSQAGVFDDVLGSLPVSFADVSSQTDAARSMLAAARAQSDAVRETSRDASATLLAFTYSHSVEHKRSLVDSLRSAIPAYEAAAARADALEGKALAAAGAVQVIADGLGSRADAFVGSLLGSSAPQDFATAAGDLRSAAATARENADALRSDAAFMQSVANEAAGGWNPLALIVGGGVGAAGFGLGGLLLLRRRIGLP